MLNLVKLRHRPKVPSKTGKLIAVFLISTVSSMLMAADPSPPGNLRHAVYSDTSAEILWDRAADDGIVVNYEIELNNEVVATLDALSYYTDTLVEGQSYTVVVTSIDNDGDRSISATTSFVGGDKSTPVVTPPTNSLTAPTNLTASVYSSKSAELFWDRPDTFGLTYEVSRNGTVLRTTDGVSHYDNGLSAGMEYLFDVVAIDQQGQRSAASSVTLQTGGSAGTTPPVSTTVAAPTGLSASIYSSNSAEIFWDRPSTFGLTYEIRRNGTSLTVTNGVSYYDDQLVSGTMYTYEVVAIDRQDQRSVASAVTLNTSGGTQEPPVAGNPNIVEPSDVYTRDGYAPVNVIRVDLRTVISPGPCNADDETGCTLADVMADIDKFDDHKVDIEVHFKSDDFPDDGTLSNASLRLRGGGSRFAPQKSFRIKLDSKEVLWREERHLQLNKHPFESSRFRNKLAMDVMSDIPALPSMRTQFVNLWIDDGEGPEDYGLFTHVERVNQYFLRKRGWNEDDNIYKAEFFRFAKTDMHNLMVDEDGKPLDKDLFKSTLDIENGKDHRALVAMMTALHNPNRSYQSVLDQYFDRDNVMAWVATNILVHQKDAVRHNFILYNPTGTEKFYFVPWDYDEAMGTWREPPNDLSNDSLRLRLEYGYAVAARNTFLENYYRQPGIHTQILAAVDNLRQNYVTDEAMAAKANLYTSLVAPFERRAPDSVHNPEFTTNSALTRTRAPGENAEALRSRFGVLMAPILDTPERHGSQWSFTWTPATDVTGAAGSISYRLQLATSPTFEADNIVVDIDAIDDATNLVQQSVNAAQLPTGEYFTRLIATPANQPERFWQVSGNKLYFNNNTFYGVLRFTTP